MQQIPNEDDIADLEDYNNKDNYDDIVEDESLDVDDSESDDKLFDE